MHTLNIIGAGKLGQSLGRLWHDAGLVRIGAVLNRTLESTRSAIQHIGTGSAASELKSMPTAEFWMITTSDAEIEATAEKLAASGQLNSDSIVFHCSGLLSSTVLESVKSMGARVASIHPVMSFAQPLSDPDLFVGTHCGSEGESRALTSLRPLFESIGAKVFSLKAEQKALYHTATALCCNQLTALTETSARLFEKAGIDRTVANQLMQPLMQATLINNFQQGPVCALTGPIARGDHSSVSSHIDALRAIDDNTLAIYQSLGKVALELSALQGNASPKELAAISRLLD